MWSQIATGLQRGNIYLIILIVMGFFGTIIIIERFLMFSLVYSINFSKFLANFKKIVQAEDIDRALNLCKSASHTGLPFISLKALEASEADPTTVRGVIEEETIDFLPKLETRLGILPAFATLMLLIGVLGTIDGLWGAFNSIEVLDTAEKQARLAYGIAGSLNSTTIALIFCLIFLSAHQILKGSAIRLSERIHYGITILHNLLVPQEVATYMPVADASLAGSQIPNPNAANLDTSVNTTNAAQAKEASNEQFDDASIEDIKDEEEII